MLTVWKAAILGALQGATEFLPVSSSGHLVVVQQLFGWGADNSVLLAFDVALHVGTLAAVVAVFWRDILDMLTGKNFKLLWLLILATIPAVIIGFTMKDAIEEMFDSIRTVGLAWIVIGVVLLLTKFVPTTPKDDCHSGLDPESPMLSWWKSLLIGCAQAIAIIPGISRSGSTIVTGIFLKLKKVDAAKFAFLMSIPAIGGGAILDAKDLASFPKDMTVQLIVGVLLAGIVGYAAIKWMLAIVNKGQLWWFGIYCLVIGVITTITMMF